MMSRYGGNLFLSNLIGMANIYFLKGGNLFVVVLLLNLLDLYRDG